MFIIPSIIVGTCVAVAVPVAVVNIEGTDCTVRVEFPLQHIFSSLVKNIFKSRLFYVIIYIEYGEDKNEKFNKKII